MCFLSKVAVLPHLEREWVFAAGQAAKQDLQVFERCGAGSASRQEGRLRRLRSGRAGASAFLAALEGHLLARLHAPREGTRTSAQVGWCREGGEFLICSNAVTNMGNERTGGLSLAGLPFHS